MKSLFKLGLIAAGSTVALPAMGQLSVTDLGSGDAFYDVVADMTNNKSDLLADHVGGVPYDEFVWDTANTTFTANRGQAGYPGGGGDFVEFSKIVEPEASTIAGLKELNLGYFGNESKDLNKFGFEFDGMDYQLAEYRKETNPYLDQPPIAKLYADEGEEFSAKFYHMDETFGTGKNYLADTDHFSVYEGSLFGVPTWIFTVDDRGNDLIDYDDGFFIAWAPEGGYIIPEPSTVGIMAVLGLAGLAFLRRRKRK